MHVSHIARFIFAALIVAIIGGFTGWYFFIQKSIDSTNSETAGRGSEAGTSFDGASGSTYRNIESTGSEPTVAEIGKSAPRLWQVTRTATAGMGFADENTRLFFAERATGNILSADVQTSSVIRLTNTLMPKTNEALFSQDGGVILRFAGEDGSVTTFSGTIATTTASTPSTSTPNVLKGDYLPRGITALAIREHGATVRGIFYIAPNTGGGSIGASAAWDGTALKTLFTSPLRNWHAQMLDDGRVVITQNAEDNIPGYSFIVAANGAMQPLLTNQPGLVVLHHPSANAVLYSTSDGTGLTLYARVKDAPAIQIALPTTAEKCVWAPSANLVAYCAVPPETATGSYLSQWYQGALHTKDVWWQINTETGATERLFATDANLSIDVENPIINASGTHIAFQNAADKTLWLLRVSQ